MDMEATQLKSDTNMGIYLRDISKTELLTPAEEVKLAAKIKRGDGKARAHMIKANLRLVVKIAKNYSTFGLPLADLVSEGNIGLMKAVERFDPTKGAKLSTYASWWIKQSIIPLSPPFHPTPIPSTAPSISSHQKQIPSSMAVESLLAIH